MDQLTNESLARRNVSFPDGFRPHPNTRIIVSMLSDDDDDDDATSTMTKEGGNNECGWPRALCEMTCCTESDDSTLSVEEPKKLARSICKNEKRSYSHYYLGALLLLLLLLLQSTRNQKFHIMFACLFISSSLKNSSGFTSCTSAFSKSFPVRVFKVP